MAAKNKSKQPVTRVKAGTSKAAAVDSKVLKSAARPKPPNAGKGRVKGVPNKATANAREAIARFVDGNADRLQEWLDKIASEDGARAAFGCFSDLLEYHVPKLSRAELTGKDGEGLFPKNVNINVFGIEPRR